jgi:hypothetical protein
MPSLKKRFVTEEHHRRPRSLGGSLKSFNVSYVEHEAHSAWHVLFGNLNAFQICRKISYSDFIPDGLRLECAFINRDEVSHKGGQASKNKFKIEEAWAILFGGMDFADVVSSINSTWLDSSYHFYIVPRN